MAADIPVKITDKLNKENINPFMTHLFWYKKKYFYNIKLFFPIKLRRIYFHNENLKSSINTYIQNKDNGRHYKESKWLVKK